MRGKPYSRSGNEIIEHARRLLNAGCPELILTGITIGKYNYQGRGLPELLMRLIDLKGEFRVRITSIEPEHVSDDLISLFESEKVCGHIHLPLQSGSDTVLRNMKRTYNREEYLSLLERIRSRYPDIAIGTDIIVGFPGEDENDFQGTLDIVRRVGFSYVHQFTFSQRSGTESASLIQNTSSQEISERSKRLRQLSTGKGHDYRRRFEGSILQSVIEKNRNRHGFTAVTDNYLRLSLRDVQENKKISGRLAPVKFTSAGISENFGELL